MQSPRLSILHIVAPAPFGGLESVLRALAAAQTRAGHKVLVAPILSPSNRSHPFVQSLEGDGVAIAPVIIADRNYLGERRAVRRIIRQHSPDIVHTHGFRPDVIDGGIALAEGIPTVSTCHGFIDAGWRGRFYQWLQRRALRRFDAVVAVSEPVARRVADAGVPRSRLHVVPNAAAASAPPFSRAEARRILDLPAGPLIGWVGRLSREKGPDVAIDALAFEGASLPSSARLVMIGAGPWETDLREQAAMLGIADRVLWRGPVPDAGRLLAAFDVFLLSSRTEGTPIALLEAMAAEVPVVATRVGGVPDVVDAGSAQLVESEDVSAIAAALADTLRRPADPRIRAVRAREIIDEKFSVDRWLSRYEAIYRSVLRSRPDANHAPDAS